MALYETIDSKFKFPTAKVKINGVNVQNAVNIEVQHSIDGLSSATVNMLSENAVVPENRVTIDQGYNSEHSRTFTGIVDSIDINEFELSYTVNCRDLLKKAMDTFLIQEVAFGIDLDVGTYFYSTYSTISGGTFQIHEYSSLSALNDAHPETTGNYSDEGVYAEAVVQWLLVMCGLQEGTEIQVDSTNFYIGDIQPARFHLESVYDAIVKIGDLIGWRIFCDVGGVCRFKKRPRNQSDTHSIWSYDTKSKKNLYSFSSNTSNTDLRNYVEVNGYNGIEVVRRSESPYIGNTPYRGVLIGNDLIDTSGIAIYMAERVLADLNRLKITLQGSCDGNPYLFPGYTVDLNCTAFSGPAMLLGVDSSENSDNGYMMNWTAEAYTTGDISPGSGEGMMDIQAVIGIDQVISIGDPTYIVNMNGAGSYSMAGPIVGYQWTLPSGTYYPSVCPLDQQEVTAYFPESMISDGNYAEVGLQVWDIAGNTATTTSGITLEDLMMYPIKYRHLYAALTDRAVASPDTGNTWYTNMDLDASSCGSSNFGPGRAYLTSGYAIFGTSSGLYRTHDMLTTAYKVADPTGLILSCHVAELDASMALFGTDQGELWKSVDWGYTWEMIKEFSFPIVGCRYAFTNQDYMMVWGEDGMYETYDSGEHWLNRDDIDGGRYIYWNDAGTMTNYFNHASGIVVYEQNTEIYECPYKDGITPSGTLTAMSIDIECDSGIMAVDNTGQHWVTSGCVATSGNEVTLNYGPLLASGEFNPDNLTRHMIRDGEIANLAYYACQEGVYKSLDRNYTIHALLDVQDEWPYSFQHTQDLGLGSTGFGEMVSYGPLADKYTPPEQVNAVIVWMKNYNDAWIYRDGGWVEITNCKPSIGSYSIRWHYVNADTFDAKKILAFGTSNYASGDYIHLDGGYIRAVPGESGTPYRYSDDGGDTWYDVRLNTGACSFRVGKDSIAMGHRSFLCDGKMYDILCYNNDNSKVYVLYGGVLEWNSSGYYEVDGNTYLYGPFDIGGGTMNYVTAFSYHRKDSNGFPIIPWISRYYGKVGYVSYDQNTDSVSINTWTTSSLGNENHKILYPIHGSGYEAIYSSMNRLTKYFSNYTSVDPVEVNLANENSFNYVAKIAIDSDNTVYSVDDRLDYINKSSYGYTSLQDFSSLGVKEWKVAAHSIQDSSEGRFVAVGTQTGEDRADVYVFDKVFNAWTSIGVHTDMINSSMSESAFAILADKQEADQES